MPTAGKRLKELRLQRGLSMREVVAASARLAAMRRRKDYFIPLSRLWEFETKNAVPSIFRLYSLSVIYDCQLLS